MVDEQNAHTDDSELQSPLDFRKDSEDENRDSEKDEDTKELEGASCKFFKSFKSSGNCLTFDSDL